MVKDDKAPHLWNSLTQSMGLDPFAVLDCFSDLGLSDAEIARYFHIRAADVAWLRNRPRGVVPATVPETLIPAAPVRDPEE